MVSDISSSRQISISTVLPVGKYAVIVSTKQTGQIGKFFLEFIIEAKL